MTHTFELVRRAKRLRAAVAACALLVFAGACNNENLAPEGAVAANLDGVKVDSVATPSDSAVVTDSLAVDSLALADSVISADSVALDEETVAFASTAMFSSGMRFGSYDCTQSGLGAYNLCNRSAGSWTLKEIKALQRLKAKVILNQGGYGKFKDSRGRYSPSKYYKWVQSHKKYAASWRPFVSNGALKGVQVIDDRGSKNWGGKEITNTQIDEMAKWWKQLVPGITTFVSGGYTWNLVGYKFRYLDGSINQFNAGYMGNVKTWRDKSVAAAKKANTSLILSLNVLDGGKLVKGCHRGGSKSKCSMSPSELRTYGAALAAAPGICGVGTWKFKSAYQSRAGVTSALRHIAGLTAKRADPSCKKR